MVVTELQIRSFLTSTVNEDWWFHSRFGEFVSGEKAQVILKECWMDRKSGNVIIKLNTFLK